MASQLAASRAHASRDSSDLGSVDWCCMEGTAAEVGVAAPSVDRFSAPSVNLGTFTGELSGTGTAGGRVVCRSGVSSRERAGGSAKWWCMAGLCIDWITVLKEKPQLH